MTLSTPWHPPPGLTDRHYDPAAGTGQFLCNPPFMTEPTPLSPAAQAVLDAANRASSYDDVLNDARLIAAAVLRAAADEVVPPPEGDGLHDCCAGLVERTRADFLAIAAELEGAG